ncbi:MAG: GGDEF-domain containing protein [endosymbiont of Seepiophila jonesi]|uniref:GGDEF-domain containing protein n=1 Tax=endosymbiont of Lamellibrachia luymesi TaxID=2200907 RepID=A0A370DZL8_9GAMM|nr:MAG: GGDEF-domain containing protein [endosymbiont of Lamellibrachia luymesi]RDH94470.1 MAG: GGDEF-domain containing protein [endosymbiont of Seepiophila jonesi]
MSNRVISINTYATIYIVIAFVSLSFVGGLTYLNIQKMESEFHDSSIIIAEKEIEQAIASVTADIQKHAVDLAEWHEVRQQLLNPGFYNDWHDRSLRNTGIFPEYVLDTSIYNSEGEVLGKLDTSILPQAINIESIEPFFRIEEGKPRIFIIAPVRDLKNLNTIGYVAILSDFLTGFYSQRRFSQIDPQTVTFISSSHDFLPIAELKRHIKYTLRSDPYAEELKKVMLQAVGYLIVVSVILTLLIFPQSVWFTEKSIRQLSRHLDFLKRHSAEKIAENLGKRLPIKELDKVRLSLNDYHNQLNSLNTSLDEKNRKLWSLALHDPLTGVKNRRAFDEYWKEVNKLFDIRRNPICLALFDVNHFKAINDTYGHQIGDEVLIAISHSIQKVLRKREYLFRLGGDEFATILFDCTPAIAMRIAERCEEAIADYPFHDFGIKEPVRISIGLALTDSETEEDSPLTSLQWQADIAMYTAKRPATSHIAVFSPEMAEESSGFFSNLTHNAVYDAVTHGTGLHMFYQPIVKLQDGTIQYYEALLRISHGNRWILPSHIFPLIEARRLEIDLDRVVINRVLEDLENNRIPAGTGISVNISAPTAINQYLTEWLKDFLPYLKTHKLVIEITETALITQLKTATKNLTALRKMGFQIALDDFGSGYSSLRYLATMPVDIVKFDISLTRNVDNEAQNRIIGHLVQMITESGHQLVAEGIETEEMSQKLASLGFVFGQGYLFGKPSPPEA